MKKVIALDFAIPDVKCGPGVYINPETNSIILISEYAGQDGRLQAYCDTGEYYHGWGKYNLVPIAVQEFEDDED